MTKLQKNLHKSLGKTGFTLIELLVVMAILGILIAVAIAGVGIAQRGARDNTRTRDLTSVKQALEDYYGANRSYPTSVTFSNNQFTIGGATAINFNQKGGTYISTGTYVTGACPSTFTVASYPASSSAWNWLYVPSSTTAGNVTGYDLCAILENGTIIYQGS